MQKLQKEIRLQVPEPFTVVECKKPNSIITEGLQILSCGFFFSCKKIQTAWYQHFLQIYFHKLDHNLINLSYWIYVSMSDFICQKRTHESIYFVMLGMLN